MDIRAHYPQLADALDAYGEVRQGGPNSMSRALAWESQYGLLVAETLLGPGGLVDLPVLSRNADLGDLAFFNDTIAERARQIALGWDAAHDDEELGAEPYHLARLIYHRIDAAPMRLSSIDQEQLLIEAAGLLLAWWQALKRQYQ